MTSTAAEPVAPGTRIQNVSARLHCSYCCNEGWVPVALRESYAMERTPSGVYVPKLDPETNEPIVAGHHEEMGPCPGCEKGERIEFPRSADVYGLWGPQGFWRGRPWHLYIKATCTCNDPVTTTIPEEYREMVERFRREAEAKRSEPVPYREPLLQPTYEARQNEDAPPGDEPVETVEKSESDVPAWAD
jgi:hypothetical protein